MKLDRSSPARSPLYLGAVVLALGAPVLAQSSGATWHPLTPGAEPGTPAEVTVDEAQSGAQQTSICVRVHGYWLEPRPVPPGFPQHAVVVPGLDSFDAPGKPSLPVARIEVAVPTEANTVQLTASMQPPVLHANVGVAPSPIAELDEDPDDSIGDGDPDGEPAQWLLDPGVYQGDATWPPSVVPPGAKPVDLALGAVPHADFGVSVAGWNPASGELRVRPLTKVLVQHPGSVPTRPSLSKAKWKLSEKRFLNWDIVGPFFPGVLVSYVGRFLFVYPDAMLAELQPLIDQKKARGYQVSLRTIESTLGTCTDIRDAIGDWYDAGSLVDQYGDAYCLLVGDIDRLPTCPDPVDGHPTDDLYASPRGDDLEEEVWLGRLSIDDAADLANQVDKILAYEDEPAQGTAWEEVALVAHEEDAPDKYEGAHEDVRTAGYAVEPTFLTFYGSTGATDADVSAAIEDGLGLVCYRGHGSSNAWTNWNTAGEYYNKNDVIGLAAGIQTPVVWSIACTNNKLEYVGSDPDDDCIGETWLEEVDSGAVAHYGAAVASYTTANHELDRQLFEAVYDDGITTHAQALAQAEAAMTSAYPTNGERNSYRYLLLGDPEMTVRRGYAQIAIDPPGGYDPPGFPGFLEVPVLKDDETPVEGALVAAWKPGLDGADDVFTNAYTGADGKALLSIDPQLPGVVRLTARDCEGNEAVAQVPVGCGPKPYGENLGGANVATLETSGGLRPGETIVYAIEITGYAVAPGTPAFAALSFGQTQLPLFGGTLLVDPTQVVNLFQGAVGANGWAEIGVDIPQISALEGKTLFAQGFVLTNEEAEGFALSNGVASTFCPIGGRRPGDDRGGRATAPQRCRRSARYGPVTAPGSTAPYRRSTSTGDPSPSPEPSMKARLLARALAFWLVGLLCLAGLATAQDITVNGGNVVIGGTQQVGARAGNVIVPQVRSMRVRDTVEAIALTSVDVNVEIARQVAITTLDIALRNTGSAASEAELLVPVPDDAIVRGFDFQGAAAEPTAQLLPSDEARATYDSIVNQVRDPALLEFAGSSLVRSSVFPVPAGGDQRVRLVYEHVLEARGDRIDYVLPRSESLIASWTPWTIRVDARMGAPISTAYSPTHQVRTERVSPTSISVVVDGEAAKEPGPFRLSLLLQGSGVSASMYAFPDARIGGGYFLLLAGLPVEFPKEARERIKREIILVLDTSGSMRGEKFEQAREAALQVLQGLGEGEAFNIVDYDSEVSSFRRSPVPRTPKSLAAGRAYLESLVPDGGTALDGALREALRQDHVEGTLPIVLFLTDGLPTVGEKNETAIRDNAADLNEHERRLFTFGVGLDVNVPLLDRLASTTRATSTYVQPGEDVEAKVSEVYARLQGPVLSSPELLVRDGEGRPSTSLVHDVIPGELEDLYEHDQLVVLGRYRGSEPVSFELSGNYFGDVRAFRFDFDMDEASLRNSFVPRLWASRRIATLIEEVRQAGADPAKLTQAAAGGDPATGELAAEILALSKEFGILTEYTSFLALEGTDLSEPKGALAKLNLNLLNRAQRARIGRAALNQSANQRLQISQKTLNRLNRHYDKDMKEVQVTRVRQAGDRAFFKRRGYWVDSRLLDRGGPVAADEVLAFGSREHRALIDRLVSEGRQGVLSMRGKVILEVDGRAVQIPGPPPEAAGAKEG